MTYYAAGTEVQVQMLTKQVAPYFKKCIVIQELVPLFESIISKIRRLDAFCHSCKKKKN